MSEVRIKKITYGGWQNCIELNNGIVDLVITADVGPRVIRYGLKGKANELCEVQSTLGMTGGDEWRIYGGHRLWHSPESKERTYEPDNDPVHWEEVAQGIRVVQKTETKTKLRKEIEITLYPESTEVSLMHRLTNEGLQEVELALWSLTAMAAGGVEVIPQSRRDTGLLPNRHIVLWPYSNLDDSRVCWGNSFIILKQNPAVQNPFKLGIPNEAGWAAYFNHGHLFIKYYAHEMSAAYPDFGASYETYTNDFMLEMETLSPLVYFLPGESAVHEEKWELFDNVPMPSYNEAEIQQALMDKIQVIP
ncbi:MAG: hypothetical protein JSU99_01930 [Nitrospiraceae bacterium]|nr:MAG: hypothetical protein JSU99_01930 [Nitrospiraceae bacterium]